MWARWVYLNHSVWSDAANRKRATQHVFHWSCNQRSLYLIADSWFTRDVIDKKINYFCTVGICYHVCTRPHVRFVYTGSRRWAFAGISQISARIVWCVVVCGVAVPEGGKPVTGISRSHIRMGRTGKKGECRIENRITPLSLGIQRCYRTCFPSRDHLLSDQIVR